MHFEENLDFGFANLTYNPDTFLEDYKKIKAAFSKEIKFQKAKLVFGKSLNYNFSKANKSQAVVAKLLSNLLFLIALETLKVLLQLMKMEN